jgi:hypothetical protein
LKVEGDTAPGFHVIRLDNFETANKGELISADETTGEVVYKDAAGETKMLKFGLHAIKILRTK